MKKVIIAAALITVLLFIPSCTGTNQTVERSGVITLEGNPLTLLGPDIKVGKQAPDFKLVAPYERIEDFANAQEVTLSQSAGKVRLISVVPSLDTPVCDLQTQRFEEAAETFENVVFYTISMDLPFAQARYCGLKKVSQMEVLSDYRDGSFGLAYGVLIKELHLLSRAIFIIDQNGTVRYVEYVKEISEHPDYDAALDALQSVINASSLPAASNVNQGQRAGNLAPDFQLNNLEGELITLSDFRGMPVLLNFWMTSCPYCQSERPIIQQIYDEWQNRGVMVLTVNIIGSEGSQENLKSYMDKNNYSFPVLLDVNWEATDSYHVEYTPTSFLIDKDGIIQEVRVGAFPNKAVLEEKLSQLLSN